MCGVLGAGFLSVFEREIVIWFFVAISVVPPLRLPSWLGLVLVCFGHGS